MMCKREADDDEMYGGDQQLELTIIKIVDMIIVTDGGPLQYIQKS